MKKQILFFVLTVCVLITAIVLLVGCSTRTTIKVQNYITLEYSSPYNGYATPKLTIDEEKLNEQLDPQKVKAYFLRKMQSDEEYKDVYGDLAELLEEDPSILPVLTDFISIGFAEGYEKLSNGDEISVIITVNDGYFGDDITFEELEKGLGIKISKKEITYKVEGLEDLSKVSVDLGKLIKVDFGKYNGYATPTASIDTEYLSGLIVQDVVTEYANKYTYDTRQLILSESEDWFSVEFEKAYNNVSNGDTITVNLQLNKILTSAGITFKDFSDGLAMDFGDGTKSFIVSGLEEPKNVLDVFEGIEQYITFHGANGSGYVTTYDIEIPGDYYRVVGDIYLSKGNRSNSVKAVHNNKNIGEITFSCNGKNLNKGDTVEITAEVFTEPFEALNYIIPTKTTAIAVPDLGKYLTTKDQLTPGIISKISDKVIAESNPTEICELYYATYKPGVECDYTSTSFIVAIIRNASSWTGDYFIDKIYDIVIKPDGTLEMLYEKHSWIGDHETLNDARSTLDNTKYNFELIG